VTLALYSIPIKPRRSFHCCVRTSAIRPSRVAVVVPFKDDRAGLRITLASLARMKPRPRLVRIVDDGSRRPLEFREAGRAAGRNLALEVLRMPANRGAACARNRGLDGLTGWIYLTDCACDHPPDHFERLERARRAVGPGVVAVAGPVRGLAGHRISRYMTEQGNLNPPMLNGNPQGVVTANVIVHGRAVRETGGFDERFPSAGGEDIDFGLRLTQFGQVIWAGDCAVSHAFANDLKDFDRRFFRYGRGLAILAEKWGADLTPYRFRSLSPDLQDLAERQYERMLEGYTSRPASRRPRRP